jgi:hypothetical protein
MVVINYGQESTRVGLAVAMAYVSLDRMWPGSFTARWRWLRRPLFTAFLFGCVVSLLECGSLTPARVAGGAVTWSWAPLLQIASLAAVWKCAPRAVGFRHAVDVFFAGNICWWLWLVLFGVCWPRATGRNWLISAAIVAVWSCFVDYRFFQRQLKSPAPVRDLLLQRAAAWIPGILVFGGGALWPGLLEKFK